MGTEIRHALGTTVFAGMLDVTVFRLLLTPVFYVLIRRLTDSKKSKEASETHTPQLGAGHGGTACLSR
ncbi:MAG: hypothetical protein E6K49_07985 [Gammaproteobacteria bacterium]|nr:MAG: hypothetical protein E6K49_07985 [Gammaproteobacteria bacterium]